MYAVFNSFENKLYFNYEMNETQKALKKEFYQLDMLLRQATPGTFKYNEILDKKSRIFDELRNDKLGQDGLTVYERYLKNIEKTKAQDDKHQEATFLLKEKLKNIEENINLLEDQKNNKHKNVLSEKKSVLQDVRDDFINEMNQEKILSFSKQTQNFGLNKIKEQLYGRELGFKPLQIQDPQEKSKHALYVEIIDGIVGHARIGISDLDEKIQYYGFGSDYTPVISELQGNPILCSNCPSQHLLQKEKPAVELEKKSISVKLNLTKEQFITILNYIDECLSNPQGYILYCSNCKNWVNSVLVKAGINETVDSLFVPENVDKVVGTYVGPIFRGF